MALFFHRSTVTYYLFILVIGFKLHSFTIDQNKEDNELPTYCMNGTRSERPNTRKAHTKKAHYKRVPERPTFGYQKGPFMFYLTRKKLK